MNKLNLSKNLYNKTFALLLCSIIVGSCSNIPVVTPASPSGIPSDLQDQLDKTSNSNNTSANNALIQSKFIYGQLVGGWNMINPIDVQAYHDTKTKLLPPMFIVANALSVGSINADKKSLTDDFRELYFNSLTQMFRGINNNLTLYQAYLENSQIINSTASSDSTGFPYTTEAIKTLANIFSATQDVELFSAQLGSFVNVSTSDETQKILDGIKNQQTIIINGILNFTTQNKITKSQAKDSYFIIVQSLTNANLLNTLGNLAISIFGKDNVAFNQSQLTPDQSNPNQVVMVIQEDDNTYRLINV
ncbi:MAG: hypothetical protein H7263_11930, partial [Candidatus Sericytochromatia bacterium]|nr:hypothetical protein [Candidatus Sericytochromatia bacterium]